MRQRIRALFRRSRFEAELDSELRDHIEKYAGELVKGGMGQAEADARARREFGAVAQVKDEVRDASGLSWADTLVRNLRYSARVLRKSPAFTLTAIATLALCIGANTAVFSIADAMLFRPLPYPEASRLLRLTRVDRNEKGWYEQTAVRGSVWEYVRDHASSIDLAVQRGAEGVNFILPGGAAKYVQQVRVSASFFQVLGVAPFMGREFTAEEDREGGPAVAVVSHKFWEAALAADPGIVGRSILLRGEPYTITGVMPPGFNTIPPADLWTPVRPSLRGEGSGSNYGVMARLRPGISLERANAELAALGGGYADAYKLRPRSVSFHLITIQAALSAGNRDSVLLLWGASGIVLLIGCVNIAGLLLARGKARQHEIATRLALGGSRGRILGQLLCETLLLAGAGGTLGLLLDYAAVEALRPIVVATLQPAQAIALDGRVLAATLFTTLLTGFVFGLYPGLVNSRGDLRAALGNSSRTASAHRGVWARGGLVAAEVALGIVLVASARLMVEPLRALTGLSRGYDGHNVMTGSVALRDARYASDQAVNRLFDSTLQAIRNTPGIEAAGIGLSLPYERALNTGIRLTDGPAAMAEARISDIVYVTPGYFEALRMKVKSGRLFDQRDRAGAPPVALVNEAYVRFYMQADVAVGRHLDLGGPVHEIVGVAGDVQHWRVWGSGFGPVTPVPTVYVPAAQLSSADFNLMHNYYSPSWVVRSGLPPAQVTQQMKAALASFDPQLPFAEFRSMEQVRTGAFTQQTLQASLLGGLAGLAVLLAAVGIYGLVANSVVERTREYGIRLALGASRRRAVSEIAWRGIWLAALGSGVGFLPARSAAALLRASVWGVPAHSESAFATAAAAMLIVAALASLLPSLRIAAIDPARTLREE